MVTSFVFCQDFFGFFKFGHFFCPFLKNPKHFWPKIFGVLYNNFSKQLKAHSHKIILMLFYIHYKRTFDDTLFKLWLNHYKMLQISYNIYVEKEDIAFFTAIYPHTKNIINYIPNSVTLLTEMDFLMSYTVDENDIMVLSYNIDHNELLLENNIIGRLFYVPIQSKILYTTFEIPDFIIYKHENHTNFTIDGIKIKNNTTMNFISNSIVSLNMNVSKVAYQDEYYETNVITSLCSINNKAELFFTNIYNNVLRNVFVNKEKQYAVIWHAKCACTTITDIFTQVNNIDFSKKKNYHVSLSWLYNKYRYNAYLQNIDIISFVRNPYERILSAYIDKHVYKNEDTYLTFEGYQNFIKYNDNTIYNLCKYLSSGGIITQHYTLISEYNNSVPYYESLNKNYVKIEDNLNKHLYDFLKKYHPDLYPESFDILNYCTNNNVYKKTQKKQTNTNVELNRKLKHFNTDEWLDYLSKYNLDYKFIIDNDSELKEMIYKIYEKDFLEFNY